MRCKKGDILYLTSGEYSDYNMRLSVKVIKGFDTKKIQTKFLNYFNSLTDPETGESFDDYRQIDCFVPWIIREGYIEELEEAKELHLGSYGKIRLI